MNKKLLLDRMAAILLIISIIIGFTSKTVFATDHSKTGRTIRVNTQRTIYYVTEESIVGTDVVSDDDKGDHHSHDHHHEHKEDKKNKQKKRRKKKLDKENNK